MIATTIGPYALIEEIGRGTSAVVYLAEAVERTPLLPRGAKVALKVLRGDSMEDGTVADRLLRTALASSRIDHPHVVRVLDVGAADLPDGRRYYLAMEFVRGRTLQDVLARERTLTEEFTRALALEAVLGLDAIHSAGMVHRDVKPANLLLAEDHSLKVMDLGVARVQDETRCSTPGRFLGTAAYAAPEQFAGTDGVDGRADLYSLGVVLYEALTGSNPFLGDTALSTMHRHAMFHPPGPRSSGCGVSEFMDTLILALLRKDPEARPADAGVVARMLREGEIPAGLSVPPPGTAGAASGGGWDPREIPGPTLRGRESEVAMAAEALARVRGGGVRCLRIRGEPGSGRSRLLAEMGRTLRGGNADLSPGFSAGGDPETELPLRGFSDLLRSLPALRTGGPLEGRGRREGTVPGGSALLEAVLEDPATAVDAWTIEGERRVVAGASSLLRSLAARGPVLLAVDDASRWDEASARALCTLLRTLPSLPLLLLFTVDSGPAAGGLPASRWFEEECRLPGTSTIDLRGLDGDASRHLLEEALGGPPSFALAEMVQSSSRGLPRLLLETARCLKEGRLLRRRGRWLDVPADALASLPCSEEDRTRSALERIGEEDRMVLDHASVLGDGFTSETLAEGLRRPHLVVLESLSRLERRHGLLVFLGDRYRFRNPSVRNAVYAAIRDDLRRELHSLAAGVPGDGAGGREGLRRCVHGLLGGRPAEGLGQLPRGLRDSWAFHTPEEGLRFVGMAEGVLDRLPSSGAPPGLRSAVLSRKADFLRALGQPSAALASHRLALEAAGGDPALLLSAELEWISILPPAVELRRKVKGLLRLYRSAGRPGGALGGDLRSRLGFALSSIGHGALALRMAQEAERILGAAGDEVQRARATAIRGRAFAAMGRFEEAEAAFREAFEAARRHSSSRLLALCGNRLGGTLFQLGRTREALEVAEVLEPTVAFHSTDRSDALDLRILCHLALGDFGLALSIMDSCDIQCRSADQEPWVNSSNRATLFVALGKFREARALAEETIAGMNGSAGARNPGTARMVVATLDELEGAPRAAEEGLEEVVRAAESSGRRVQASDARGTLCRLLVGRGAPGARSRTTSALLEARRLGHRPSIVELLLTLAHGEKEEGGNPRPLLEEAEGLLRKGDFEPIALLTLFAVMAGLLDRMGKEADAAGVRRERDRRVEAAARTLPEEGLRGGLLETAARLDRGFTRGIVFHGSP